MLSYKAGISHSTGIIHADIHVQSHEKTLAQTSTPSNTNNKNSDSDSMQPVMHC